MSNMNKNKAKVGWHLSVKRPNYLLDVSLVFGSDLNDLKNYCGLNYSQTFAVLENGQASWYVPESELEKQIKWLKNNPAKIKAALTQFPRRFKEVKKLSQKMISGMDLETFQSFIRAYQSFVAYRVLTRVIGYIPDLAESDAKKIAKVRLDFKNYWTEIRDNLEKPWSLLASRYEVPVEAVKLLTLKEFLSCLRQKNFDFAVKHYQKRKGKMIYYKTNARETILTDLEAEMFIKKNLKISIDNAGLIKGQIACSGKARGAVKIIFDPGKSRLKGKFILVTSMTTPQFVPLLKKAKAIVTDEGGLTCHAAIISRELNIPCITGTKIATQVLKNGDLVEVDAKIGIVRKI